MLIYNYHPFTGELLGSDVADESPREPGVFLIPAYATTETPPTPVEGQLIRFVEGAWGYSPVTAPDTPPTEEPVEPEPIDPLTVPLARLDFWLAAAEVGVSKWAVRDTIAALPEDTPEAFKHKAEVIAWFEEAERYRREDPILIAMAEAQGINEEQLDALWVWAVPEQT